jgi:UDP-GlcNAc:undecaprenyl-phosphate/decaprenyl-phosphate GlcNAc-1-phosphate transferase
VTVPAAIAGSAIAAGALAFVLVALLTEVMRRVAIRHRLVDRPRTDRIHASATPFLGGVAIVGGTLGAVAMVAHADRPQTLAITLAAAVVATLGLIDDLRQLSPRFRLITECLVATALVATGVHVNALAGLPVIGRWLDDIGTAAWIVVVTNSFNLLDNMDGVAAAVAFVTSALLATLAFATGRPGLAILLVAVSAACAGFLAHNWTPARIFMGDTGSLFLGFVISASAVLTCGAGSGSGTPATTVACALLLMTFVAVVDTCTVVVSRSRADRTWTQGGADHLSHRMRAVGLGTARIVILLSLAAAVTGTLGLMVITGIVPAQGFLAATVAVGAALVALAQKVEVYRPRSATLVASSSRYRAREHEHEHDLA